MTKHTVIVAFEGLDFGRDDQFTKALLDDSLKCYDGTGFDFSANERHHWFYVTDETLEFVVNDIKRTLGATVFTGTVTVKQKGEHVVPKAVEEQAKGATNAVPEGA